MRVHMCVRVRVRVHTYAGPLKSPEGLTFTYSKQASLLCACWSDLCLLGEEHVRDVYLNGFVNCAASAL